MLSQPSHSETLTPAAPMALPLLLSKGWHLLRQPYIWLLAPVMLVLAVFFVLPLLTMIQYSVYTQVAGSTMTPDVTLDNFAKFFQHELYRRILVKTLSNALITTLLALLLGYPVAYAIARGQPLHRQASACAGMPPCPSWRDLPPHSS